MVSARNVLMIFSLVVLAFVLAMVKDYFPNVKDLFISHYRSINSF